MKRQLHLLGALHALRLLLASLAQLNLLLKLLRSAAKTDGLSLATFTFKVYAVTLATGAQKVGSWFELMGWGGGVFIPVPVDSSLICTVRVCPCTVTRNYGHYNRHYI